MSGCEATTDRYVVPGGIVDAHVHVASDDRTRYPVQRDYPEAPAFVAPIEQFTAIAGPAGVTQAVLVQSSMYGPDHRYLMDTLAVAPGRYVGVVLADPTDAGFLGRLERLVEEGPISGMRFAPNLMAGRGWFDERADETWRRAAALGVVATLLVRPSQLAGAATWRKRHPGLPIVIDHLARPDLFEGPPLEGVDALVALARHREVTVKVSALAHLSSQPFPHRDIWEWIRRVVEAFGIERTMWGSDFPDVDGQAAYRSGIEVLEHALPGLSGSERAELLAGTARRIFRLRVPDTS